jgi:leucyl-tRNA synthetase
LGPLEQSKPWNTSGIEGVYRFLQKTWRWMHGGDESDAIVVDDNAVPDAAMRVLHQTIDKITKDIPNLNFNTCVSQFMICVNELASQKVQNKAVFEAFTLILSPFAPHLAEELWSRLGHKESISTAHWPKVDPKFLVSDTFRLVVQINGKLRDQFDAPVGISEADALQMAMDRDAVKNQLNGKELKKKIYVPGRLVNFVVG